MDKNIKSENNCNDEVRHSFELQIYKAKDCEISEEQTNKTFDATNSVIDCKNAETILKKKSKERNSSKTNPQSTVAANNEVENRQDYYIIPDDISKSPEEGPTQPKLDVYPKTLMSTSRYRSFCSNWYNRFPWLEYSISFDKVYCFACRHYSSVLYKPSPSDPPGKKHPLRKGATVYATTGFCRWAKAHERMQRHNSSARHLEAMGPWLEDTLNREKNGLTFTERIPSQIKAPDDNPDANAATVVKVTNHTTLPSKRKRSRPIKKLKLDEDVERIEVPTWCGCCNCIEMSKLHECVCCCDVPEIRTKVEAFDPSLPCVTGHPGFASICLNKWAIQVAYYQHKQQNGAPSVSEDYECFRYIAYCQFVRWCWGFLSEDMHIPLPSCVVNSIKAVYHSKANLPSLHDLPTS